MHHIRTSVAVVFFVIVLSQICMRKAATHPLAGLFSDPSQAYIPGVTVTATNTQTEFAVDGTHK